MEKIIEKINQIEDSDTPDKFVDWSLIEKKKLLEIYFIICKKENHIFDLIYKYHGCDSWEDIFRDYDKTLLQDKSKGVKIAIEEIQERINIAIEKIQKRIKIATKEIQERIKEEDA
jgi:gas vesicle protein